MEKVRFGKTQMQVTPMTLGTWGIGGAEWDTNSDETGCSGACGHACQSIQEHKNEKKQ